MNDDQADKIIQTLKERGVNLRCPRCAQGEFDLVGFSQLPVSDDPNESSIADTAIPVVLVVCPVCGFVMQHALMPLGIISQQAEVAK
jgi:uncharacterized protein (DUF983 family)